MKSSVEKTRGRVIITKRSETLLILPLIFVLFVIGILPLFSVTYNSFLYHSAKEETFAGFKNYLFILSDKGFYLSVAITLLWSILNTLFTITISFLLAASIYQNNSLYKILHPFLLIPIVIPVFITIPLWRAVCFGDGMNSLLNTLTGIKINLFLDPTSSFIITLTASIWLYIPISTLVILGVIRNIPRYTIESARLEGASDTRINTEIILPQIKETIVALSVIVFIKRFKEFTLIFLMTGGGPPLLSGFSGRNIIGATTTLELYLYNTFIKNNDIGISSAFSVIMILILILLIILWRVIIRIKRRASSPLRFHILPDININRPISTLFSIFIIILSFTLIYQVVWMSLSAISVNYIDRIIPAHLTLKNFPLLISRYKITKNLINTLLLALPTALLTLSIVIPASHFLKKLKKLHAHSFLISIQILGVLSGMHTLTALYVVLMKLKLLDSYTPIIIIYVFHSVGFALYTYFTFIRGIPPSLRELGIVEGASNLYYIRKVLIPLSLPIIGAIFIVAFLNAWNGFLIPLILLTTDSKYPISLVLYSFIGNIGEGITHWNLFAAASLINALILILLFIPMRKYITTSFLSRYQNSE